MHKGQDTIRMITKDVYKNLKAAGYNMDDDVLKIQTFRYLSAGEAMCRIIGYNLSQSSVGCTRLAVHLPDQDWVGDGAAAETASSTLLDFFKRPAALAAHTYLAYYSKYNVTKASAAEKQAAAAAGGLLVRRQRGDDFYVDNGGKKVSVRSSGRLGLGPDFCRCIVCGKLGYGSPLHDWCCCTSCWDGANVVGGQACSVCSAARCTVCNALEYSHMMHQHVCRMPSPRVTSINAVHADAQAVAAHRHGHVHLVGNVLRTDEDVLRRRRLTLFHLCRAQTSQWLRQRQ
jgi:hypothetical protein